MQRLGGARPGTVADGEAVWILRPTARGHLPTVGNGGPTAAAAPEAAPDQEAEERYSYESPSFGSGGSGDIENDRTDWSEPEPSLQAHLRNQLMLSPMGPRDRALTQFIVDALDDDGYLKVSLDELAALLTTDGGVEDGPSHWRRALAEAFRQC